MHFVDAAEQVVEVAHDILVGAHEEEADEVGFELAVAVHVQCVEGERVANIANR